MTDETSALAQAVLDTSPHEEHDLQGMIHRDDAPPDAEGVTSAATVELIGPYVWAQQWGLLHDMLGGMVMARTGQPCPLGNQARSEGGQIACQAAYDLIALSPARDMILGAHSTFAGQILAVGMHGFACVQIVKASRIAADQATFDAAPASFKTVRPEAA